MGTVLLVLALSVGIVGGLVLGLRMYDRALLGSTIWRRLPWIVPLIVLLLVEFVLVVEWRCALGLIDESECLGWSW